MNIKYHIKKFLGSGRFKGSAHYWDSRYDKGGNSGAGSYGEFAVFKAEVINSFVRENDIKRVLELGCGDGNQLRYFKFPEYVGLDISSKAVNDCHAKFSDDDTKSFFLESEFESDEKFDLTMSLDVIYHLVEDNVFEQYMYSLFEYSGRYVVIYSSNQHHQFEGQRPHVRHRKFSEWIKQNVEGWSLKEIIPNKYPYDSASRTGSFADFFFYNKG